VQSLKSRRRTSLRTARCRVGKTADSDIRVHGKACDEHQCTLEFDGRVWRLKQESLSHPTFVDGNLNPYVDLKPGSKLTFLDGSGFILKQVRDDAKESFLTEVPRWAIAVTIAGGVAVVAGVACAAWKLFG
jgi:hypothetical protein